MLRIPRRPKWQELNAKELKEKENLAFLEWRKGLAVIEESGRTVTPFEKNIEVWRQLWRVVDKSDIIL